MGSFLCSDEPFVEWWLPNLSPLQNEVGQPLRKKNHLLLEATEEAAATITVGVLSTPNAMRYAHRPTHGALLLPCGKKFFSFKGLTNKEINVII